VISYTRPKEDEVVVRLVARGRIMDAWQVAHEAGATLILGHRLTRLTVSQRPRRGKAAFVELTYQVMHGEPITRLEAEQAFGELARRASARSEAA